LSVIKHFERRHPAVPVFPAFVNRSHRKAAGCCESLRYSVTAWSSGNVVRPPTTTRAAPAALQLIIVQPGGKQQADPRAQNDTAARVPAVAHGQH
jgi:hypothetical protein